ncbi:jg14329 [Pararge aegeria aegeria]|uniref:Jg14329 protein n=1 Tax=Pararge aegeria aegeria TaxID=348720 RepID=A0A8S4R5D2_9NEOP|nr:jg14329 [Pararge aegeria aegeria]
MERFLMFIENSGHKAKDLLLAVLSVLEFFELDLADCRGQSYDNANNVSGIYSGLQARIHEINHLAEHAPCAALSMNFVGVHAVECAPEAASFFNTVQTLYNFLTASTHRWEVLQSHAEKRIALKSLSATRWSARYEAV